MIALRSRKTAMPGVLLAILLVLFSFSAGAQEVTCPDGNLLSAKEPAVFDGARNRSALTNGVQPHEGALWNTELTGALEGEGSFLVYDLQRAVVLNGLLIQTDNNDTMEVHVSLDGSEFRRIWTVPAVPGQGMRTRVIGNLDAQGRFLRIGNPKGDGFFSIGEVQAFCRRPSPWPPLIPRVGVAPDAAGSSSNPWWQNREHQLAVH